MKYLPYGGSLADYGYGPEHRFFEQAPAQVPVPVGTPSAYDSAMRTLGNIAAGSPGQGSFSDGGGNTSFTGAPGPSTGAQSTGMDRASSYGTVGSVVGALTGTAGLGMLGGAIGGVRDAAVANDVLATAYGLPANVSPGQAVLAGMTSTPFGSIVGQSAFSQLADRAGNAYSSREGNFADKSANADKDGPEDFSFTGAPVAAVDSELLGLSVPVVGPAINLNSAPTTGIPTGQERAVDQFGNTMYGTSRADNSLGSIDGFGGSAPNAFGNFPTVQSFIDYLNGAPAPWDVGGAPPPSGPIADPFSDPGTNPYGGRDPEAGGGGGGGGGGGHASDSYGGGTGDPNGSGAPFAAGGVVSMVEGGFVVPADVVSGLGDGSTMAGYRRLGLGQLLEGPGTGMSDDIPAHIDGEQPAAVADGEVYLSPKEVALVGGGRHADGVKRLYALMDEVRKKRHGTTKQPKPLTLGDM